MTDSKTTAATSGAKQPQKSKNRFAVGEGDVVALKPGEKWTPKHPSHKPKTELEPDSGERFAVSFGDVVPLEADEKLVPGDPYANPPTPGHIVRPDGTTRPALSGKAGLDALAALNAGEGRGAPQAASAEPPAPPIGVVRWKRVEASLRPLGADGAAVGPDVAYETVSAARAARRKLNAAAKPTPEKADAAEGR